MSPTIKPPQPHTWNSTRKKKAAPNLSCRSSIICDSVRVSITAPSEFPRVPRIAAAGAHSPRLRSMLLPHYESLAASSSGLNSATAAASAVRSVWRACRGIGRGRAAETRAPRAEPRRLSWWAHALQRGDGLKAIVYRALYRFSKGCRDTIGTLAKLFAMILLRCGRSSCR